MALSVAGQLDDWLRYSQIGFTAAKGLHLLRSFGSPRALLTASEDELSLTAGLTPDNVAKIRAAAQFDLTRSLNAMQAFGLSVVVIDDEGYPARLRTIADPPPVLYLRGAFDPADESAVAIVGTRRASTYGRLVAERLASDLARRGVTVVSGLARGIDAAAHGGALRAGGRTLAVCGCGLDVPYPRENADLAGRIAGGPGACLTEFAVGRNPEAWHFPARNRIISALALGVLVIEAPENSGALITADYAAEQGREVFAVPGNIDSGKFKGCHRLIQEGAKLVETVEDILEELKLVTTARDAEQPKLPLLNLSPLEHRVVRALSLAPKHIDEVTREAELTAAQTSATLLQLEIKGLARKLPGSQFVRTS